MSEPVTVRILDREYTVGVSDEERARLWLSRGAQPSDTVRKLLKIQGIS